MPLIMHAAGSPALTRDDAAAPPPATMQDVHAITTRPTMEIKVQNERVDMASGPWKATYDASEKRSEALPLTTGIDGQKKQ